LQDTLFALEEKGSISFLARQRVSDILGRVRAKLAGAAEVMFNACNTKFAVGLESALALVAAEQFPSAGPLDETAVGVLKQTTQMLEAS